LIIIRGVLGEIRVSNEQLAITADSLLYLTLVI